jgi:hypothetical protein
MDEGNTIFEKEKKRKEKKRKEKKENDFSELNLIEFKEKLLKTMKSEFCSIIDENFEGL